LPALICDNFEAQKSNFQNKKLGNKIMEMVFCPPTPL